MKIFLFIWGRMPFPCPHKTCTLLQVLLSLRYQFSSKESVDSSVDLVNIPVVIYHC